MSFKRLVLFCALLFLGGWMLRLAGIQGAFQCDDSPETAAACATLGIQHPPGYPFPTLAGRLAVLGLPGNPAFRLNLLAAFFACLCPCLILVIGWRIKSMLGLESLAADAWLLIAAFGFLGMPQLACQGSAAKGGIYTLNLFLTLLAWLLFWEARHAPRNSFRQSVKWLQLGLLVLGLGLAGHFMSLGLFLPAFAALGIPILWRDKARASWVWSLVLILSGLSLYMYLPLRSSLGPALNWGQPDNWKGFWEVLTRSQYLGGDRQYDFEQFTILSGHFLRLLPAQTHWLGLGLAAWGLVAGFKARTLMLRSLMLVLILHLAAVILYNNPPKHAPWVADAFFLPDFALLWIFAVLGGLDLLKRLPDFRAQVVLLAAAILAFSTGNVLAFQQNNYSRDFLDYDYGRDLLAGLPPRAVLLAAGGGDTFSIWYLQNVEGRRTDVLLVDVPLFSYWYFEQLRKKAPEVPLEGSSREEIMDKLLHSGISRPLYYTTHNPGSLGLPFGLVTLVPNGPMQMSLAKLEGPWHTLRLRSLWDSGLPLGGPRSELRQYYPDSAKAVREFGERQGLRPVVELGKRCEKKVY